MHGYYLQGNAWIYNDEKEEFSDEFQSVGSNDSDIMVLADILKE